YSGWFPIYKKQSFQHYLTGMLLVAPDRLIDTSKRVDDSEDITKEQLTITERYNLCGRFDHDQNDKPADLMHYVNDFIKIIKESNGKCPIAIALSSINHAITIGYHPDTKELLICDANIDEIKEEKNKKHIQYMTSPGLYRFPLDQDFNVTADLVAMC